MKFLSTLSLRRATQRVSVRVDKTQFLSTLSLRRATARVPACLVGAPISIHALLAESDKELVDKRCKLSRFLSTLSLRRATESQPLSARPTRDFYPRSPCGERQDTGSAQDRPKEFLSTLSLRRATLVRVLNSPHSQISIHALLAESDCSGGADS